MLPRWREFGMQLAKSKAWRRTSQLTLRISIVENSEAVTLKLEGRLAGPWVAELDRLWEKTSPARSGRQLALDLREITYADAGGIRALRSIYSETGAEILSSTPLTRYLAQEIVRGNAAENKEV